jgi:FAD dependent oxidoreductase TIGR03364
MNTRSVLIIGAGIVGLAMARAFARRGYRVTVLERSAKANGASVRNFGMVWPIGQPKGDLYQRALMSRHIWEETAREAKISFDPVGSLHLAYNKQEAAVLEEFYEQEKDHRPVRLISATEISGLSPAARPEGMSAGLFSNDELIVDPREAIANLPAWLTEKYGVRFHWQTSANTINGQTVYTANGQAHSADLVFVCSGADFETLYPEIFAARPVVKCKLQMMRMVSQPGNWKIGPALCGGLSLIHYRSFQSAPSLAELHQYYKDNYPAYLDWGIHVMASQNADGEITVGDSHEYGLTPDPFDKQFINRMILDYLSSFARFKDETVQETWHGIYPKLTNGETEMVTMPAPGVWIVNGLGGAGMTLSFGLSEELTERIS